MNDYKKYRDMNIEDVMNDPEFNEEEFLNTYMKQLEAAGETEKLAAIKQAQSIDFDAVARQVIKKTCETEGIPLPEETPFQKKYDEREFAKVFG